MITSRAGVNGLFFVVALVFSWSLHAAESSDGSLSVTLWQQNKHLNYPSSVRLATLLGDAYQSLEYEPYAPGAALIDVSAEKKTVTALQRRVLQQLKMLGSPSAMQIVRQLSHFQYVRKIPVNLDLDEVRVSSKDNPMLSGRYELSLPKRPAHITLVGALKEGRPVSAKVKLGAVLDAYLNEVQFQNDADRYHPWVIQADGAVHQVKYLSWEGSPTFLSPGAIVFVGLESLPEQYKHLNENIAQLLASSVER